MGDLERLQEEYKANSKQGKKMVTRYQKRMQDNEVAFNAIFAKIWELEPRAEGTNNPFASNKNITEQAIEAVGYNLNSEIARAFFQHEKDYYEFYKLDAKGLELGFKIAALTIEENAHKEATPTQGNEWLFVPIRIVAPQQIQDEIITPLIQADAQNGEGLFANNTDIPLEDESEDDFLMIEAYDCNASLSGYWQELKDYGIIGIGKADAFFPYQFRQFLLQLLKEVATFIKDNTNKPSKAKNKVTTTLKGLDKIPVWGLFFQILLLQGLCRWLESVDVNEGDKGYKEAQLMYNWLCLALAEKEMLFCHTPYGDKDKQMLQPLCNYLYSTEIGKEVQKCMREYLFGKPQQEVATPKIKQSKIDNIQLYQQIDNRKKGKGRPSKPFNSVLVGDEDKKNATLKILHQLIKEKTDSKAVLYIKVAISMGLIQKPTYTQFTKEFGQIVSKAIYNKYVAQNLFSEDEIIGARQALTNTH